MSEDIMENAVETATTPTVVMPEMDLSALERTNSDVLLRSIARNCVAVKLSIGAVGSERKIPNARVSLGEREVTDSFLAGASFKIIPPAIQNPLSKLANRARQVPCQYGTPFVGGAYLVPLAATSNGRSPAQMVFDTLKLVRQEYVALALGLKGAWEEHISKIREDFPFEYSVMSKWLISGEEFVQKHTISTMLFPLGAGLPVDFNNRLNAGMSRLLSGELMPQEDKAALLRVRPQLLDMIERASQDVGTLIAEEAADTWVSEAREATSAAVALAVKSMIQGPAEEFANSLANIEGILARGGNIRTSTMDNLKQAFDKLMGFSFMVPEDLKARLRSAGSIINGVSVRDINTSEESGKELSRHFAAVREDLTSMEAHEAMYGQFMLTLDV